MLRTSLVILSAILIQQCLELQIDGEQFEKILKYIRIGQDAGATLETGGDRHGTQGYYIQPTVFSNVKVISYVKREMYKLGT